MKNRSLPPLYRAVVEAGARSGQLPVALEGLARYVRGYSEARATIGLALWYPLVVLSLAYALFVGMVMLIVPRFLDAFESLGLASPAPLRWLSVVGQTADYWWLAGPIALAVLAIAWVRSGQRRGSSRRRGAGSSSSRGCGRSWPITRQPTSASCSPCCSSTR